MKLSEFKLIITVALKKEMPKKWFVFHGVPVHTIEALRSGAHVSLPQSARGMMVIVTGAGYEASTQAACWIRDNLDPLFVINIGTCGVLHHDLPLREWIRPRSVINESGDRIELDTRSPIPVEKKMIDVHSLLTVKEVRPGNTPDPMKNCDLVDMECFSQAAVFSDTSISFHSLKFGTDYADAKAIESFNENLGLFVDKVKELFDFIGMNEQNMKVSVVIPVYSREHTIRRAVDSVLAQSAQADEVIIVDDDSTDRTFSLLKGYGRKVKIISLLNNAGPSKARNEGVRFARNEWIAFLDSDDEWERDKLKKQIRYLTTYPFYEIIQSDEKWIRNNIRINHRKHHAKKAGWIFDESLERCMISPSSVLVRRSMLERYGHFDESLPVCEDYDLWLKITRYHPVGFNSNMTVIKYGGHEDQLSRKFPAMDRFRVQSLHRLLKNERSQSFRNKIIPVLEKKLKILISGCEKRNKMLEARELKALLGSVNDEDKTVTTDHG